MATLETTKRFSRFKHAIVADWTSSCFPENIQLDCTAKKTYKQTYQASDKHTLQLLGHTLMFVILQRHTSVAAHTVAIIDAKSETQTTDVTVGTMIYRVVRVVVVKAAYTTAVLGERLWVTLWVDTTVTGRLQGATSHAQDLRYCVSIERRVLVLHWHLPFLLTAQSTCVESS